MDIRVATRADETQLLDTLTLAFAADPMVRYWWPGATEYLEWWPKFVLARGERGLDAGAVLAALDLPGDAESEQVSAELSAEIDRHHPAAPHWYLWTLGVDPRLQSRGVGSALLRHKIAEIDAEGATAYLESSDPKNVPFYERHGFEATGVIQVRDLPPLTPMIRPGR